MTIPDTLTTATPDDTFELGETIGASLRGGEVLLLTGGLGAGKTLLTKGILSALDFDVDEVTSPSFALVNLYKTDRFDVYHIDLWRSSSGGDAAFDVGLHEILEDASAVVIIEWAERLGAVNLDRPVIEVAISGDGEEPRDIRVKRQEQVSSTGI
ncbi:MAG TPA: tRNA (adenosine(37)-N6)-threonylcarbamoyltransferase complex ATPase subunit type 1 TsaE [Pyrinomonadaceae bacterium]|nr:tRNA (adenosine(37)-N6)-threonylcarbamoyltransferase complex ATPase subunit type 1 TsaE [Pyrinomonadaceae bacterium]